MQPVRQYTQIEHDTYDVHGGDVPNYGHIIPPIDIDEFIGRIGWQFTIVNMSAERYFLGYASTATRLRGKLL